jgi:tetratricopeptide (TPR) repeat protein
MSKANEKRKAPAPEGKNGQVPQRVAGAARSGAAPAPQTSPGRNQMASFEEAMRLFHARQFRQARELFQAARAGADRAVAHRAELHARICDRRLQSASVDLNTPEDHYNYAVALINTRDLAGAQQHLRVALEADPGADHVWYALAACQGLAGDLQGAYENLKQAIDLQPRNRLAARQDPDFAAIADQPAIAGLLYPDKKS